MKAPPRRPTRSAPSPTAAATPETQAPGPPTDLAPRASRASRARPLSGIACSHRARGQSPIFPPRVEVARQASTRAVGRLDRETPLWPRSPLANLLERGLDADPG